MAEPQKYTFWVISSLLSFHLHSYWKGTLSIYTLGRIHISGNQPVQMSTVPSGKTAVALQLIRESLFYLPYVFSLTQAPTCSGAEKARDRVYGVWLSEVNEQYSNATSKHLYWAPMTQWPSYYLVGEYRDEKRPLLQRYLSSRKDSWVLCYKRISALGISNLLRGGF